jgi:hypothetical protein
MLTRFVPSAGGDSMTSKTAADLSEDLFPDDEIASRPLQAGDHEIASLALAKDIQRISMI